MSRNRNLADLINGIDASKITTGTFADARIAASNVSQHATSFDDNKMWGNICIVINATSYALYLVLVKPLMKKYHPITVITWVFLFGLIFVTPFGIQPFLESDFHSMPTVILWEILFVVLGTTFLAYLLNIVALERVSSTVVSTYVYLQPVIATIVALIVASDSLDSVKLISSALVFLGVYFVSKKS